MRQRITAFAARVPPSDEHGTRSARALSPLPPELALARAVEVALQPRETIEEELAVEVIDLVLQRDRQ